jgi:2-oxoglutarate ferredoxin oxidoreductase subunit alpha
VAADYLRVRGFPFSDDVERFINGHDVTFVVEQNRDAQLRSLLTLELNVSKQALESVLYYGGLPLSSHHVVNGVLEALP